jgi:hypothetical protein
LADTTFTTPLSLTRVVGNVTTTTISADANGFFPDFTVDNRTSVVWKQNGSSFTTVLTTTDPVPGAKGDKGDSGSKGDKGDRGDLAAWQASTFYPLNQVISDPLGNLVRVTTAHTSGASYDATKFEYAVPPTLTPAVLNATYVGLIQAAKNPDLLIAGAVTLNGSDEVTSAAVLWPDGTPGTLTITARHATGAVNAYNITYGSPVTKTFTQPTITRNANGAATNVPQIVVS